MKQFRAIPKVDKVLSLPQVNALLADHPRRVVLLAVRAALELLRTSARKGELSNSLCEEEVSALVGSELKRLTTNSLRRVVNGTGVVIHTNLGRSLLAGSACRHIAEIAGHYSNLEIDLATGERGERYSHVEGLLCELTGAESALVVNNNAAAVLLALSGLASGREVVVSRGELVEIGGSFRVPDVMRQSGGVLREVGTTNRTHLKDYQQAISAETSLLLKVHTSNFKVVGFTAEVGVPEMAELAGQHGIPFMADIGSGCMVDLAPYGIAGETPIQEYLKAGVDIITCSGDKMLGGPQAGIILGKRAILDELRCHPLLRALRIDKLTLAALEATLRLYRDERTAIEEIPTLRMLTATCDDLHETGRRYLRRLRNKVPPSVKLTLQGGSSQVGGGSLPLLELKSWLITVDADGWSPLEIDMALRRCEVPVVGRIYRNQYLLDLRTIQEGDIAPLERALALLTVSA